jgi:hypothetical protein
MKNLRNIQKIILNKFVFIVIITLSYINYSNCIKKEKEEAISDSELDAMLKDPKYASLIGSNAEELLKASPELTKGKKSSKSKSHDDLGVGDIGGLDSLDLKDLESTTSSSSKKKEDKVEDKFQTYDFITKQQARYLIEILKQPVFFNMLPSEAQQIVKVTKDNFQFKMTQDGKIDDFIETNMVNTPSSQSFIDTDGQVGRKGVLSIIDPINSVSKFVWGVLNAKTFTLFESQSFLTIVKLYRNSHLEVKDVPATPCFMTSNKLSKADGAFLICSNSTQEKEVWIQTILSALNKNSVNQVTEEIKNNLK